MLHIKFQTSENYGSEKEDFFFNERRRAGGGEGRAVGRAGVNNWFPEHNSETV